MAITVCSTGSFETGDQMTSVRPGRSRAFLYRNSRIIPNPVVHTKFVSVCTSACDGVSESGVDAEESLWKSMGLAGIFVPSP